MYELEARLRRNSRVRHCYVQGVAVLSDDRIVAGHLGTMSLWDRTRGCVQTVSLPRSDVGEGRRLQTLPLDRHPFRIAALPNGRVAAGYYDEEISIYCDRQRELEAQIAGEVGRQRACADVVKVIAKFL